MFNVEWVETTSSTNDDLLEAAKRGAPSGKVLVANSQTNGRGRMGRSWVDRGAHSALLCSILWRFFRMPAPNLSLVIGIELAKVLRQYAVPVNLKWPNDLYIGNSKLGGILIEGSSSATVIGFGINFMAPSPQQFDYPVVGVFSYNHCLSREILLDAILHALKYALVRYDEEGFVSWKNVWHEFCGHHHKEVSLFDPISGKLIVRGVSMGIDKQGSLLIYCAISKKVHAFVHGEVRLRYDSEIIS
jgi:biotin-[acetyl-CoA-carboxylase] ligase BirA-like protein